MVEMEVIWGAEMIGRFIAPVRIGLESNVHDKAS
jgi:hypothetical protein